VLEAGSTLSQSRVTSSVASQKPVQFIDLLQKQEILDLILTTCTAAFAAYNLFRPSVNSILVPQGSVRNASARPSSGLLV
jgi:hypothetical protein